jgi:hypothetical protein
MTPRASSRAGVGYHPRAWGTGTARGSASLYANTSTDARQILQALR